MALIKVAGFDPSLRNWGFAIGVYDSVNKTIQVEKVDICQPAIPSGKQVRQNSKDLLCAEQLTAKAVEVAQTVQATFVEVPVGSQSARAMASYGICVGVLGALRAGGIPFFEVTPTEVKIAAVNQKNASKQDMINWAVDLYPNAGWPSYKKNGAKIISASSAEHMADAVAAIHAGVQLSAFQQLISLIKES